MTAERRATFAEHIRELRSRLMWTLLFVALGAGLGYALHNSLLTVLQQPLHETLYYTNPTGAFSFIIKICTVFGVIVALPMALYQGFSFFEPLITTRTRRMLVWYVFVSVFLAAAGIAFAYFISLPAALHFLVNFGNEGSIESLITANEYFNFVLAYIAGFAALFQLPLIITFINKVTPLTPRKLLSGTRYVILGSFIVAAVITPTPDPFNQLLMAGPIILLYFASACVIAFINRGSRRRVVPVVAPVSAPAPKPEPVSQPSLLPQLAPVPIPLAPQPQQRRQRPGLVADVVIPNRRGASVAAYQRRPVVSKPVQNIRPVASPRPRLISDFVATAD